MVLDAGILINSKKIVHTSGPDFYNYRHYDAVILLDYHGNLAVICLEPYFALNNILLSNFPTINTVLRILQSHVAYFMYYQHVGFIFIAITFITCTVIYIQLDLNGT